jgi:hypothetical protein
MVSKSISEISSSISLLSSSLEKLDINKLEALNKIVNKSIISNVFDKINSLITPENNNNIETINSSNNQPIQSNLDISPLIDTIKDLKIAISNLQKQQITVNLDGRKIGTGTYNASLKSV